MPEATVTTVEHNEASRLPEPKWFWRRWLIYIVTLASLIILSFTVWVVLQWVRDIGTLRLIIRYCFYTMWTAVILYGVGASVTDVAVLASAVRTTRKETVTTAPTPATITAAGTTTVSTPVIPAGPLTGVLEAAKDMLEKPPWKR